MLVHKNYITRLSRYKNALKRLKSIGMIKVFADNLADASGVSPVQVRKDFSIFGIAGNKKGGYQIDQLVDQLEIILGKSQTHNIIVVGSGHIGKALLNYRAFEREKINIIAAFDIEHSKINREHEIPILPLNEMKQFIKENDIKIAILSVPALVVQETLDQMVEAGIKGVLNFAPIRLFAPEHVFINNVDLQMELETVLFYTYSPVRI